MAYIDTFEDDTGREIASLVTAHDRYLLADGVQMFVQTDAGWCLACRRFVNVEILRSADELVERARRWHRDTNTPLPPGNEELQSFHELQVQASDRLLADRLREAARWRDAMRSRLSPPRCLECGSVEFVRIPRDGSWVEHPGEPGRRVRMTDDICHASMSHAGRLFDTEGRVIPGAFARG